MECRTCYPCHCPLLLDRNFLISELYHRAQVGKTHHLHGDIQWLTLLGKPLPPLEHLDRRAGDQRAKAGKALAMEGGLHEASLMQPGVPVIGDEPIADKGFEGVEGEDVFGIVAMIVLENMLDLI